MCDFDMPFTGSASGFITKIKSKIEAAGGTFDGDEIKGVFSVPTPVGAIEGNCAIKEQLAAITIIKKPFLLSCKAIEKYVNSGNEEGGA